MTRIPFWLRLIFVVIAISLFVYSGASRSVKDAVQSFTLPMVTRMTRSKSVQQQAESDRVADLEKRLMAVSVDYVKLKAYEEENRALRAQARFLDRSDYESVGARVIRRSIEGQRASFLIDRGTVDALEIGQAVITDNGIMIGKVTQLYGRVAEVSLIIDSRSRVATALQGEGRLTGVLEGKGNGAMALTYIPSSAKLSTDQLLVTAGTEEKVPANLPIGFISVVQGKSSDPFLTASIESLIRFDEVAYVSVLRPSALAPRL